MRAIMYLLIALTIIGYGHASTDTTNKKIEEMKV